MKSHSSIDDLSPTRSVVLGIFIACVGLLCAWKVNTHPEGLRAPAWVAFAACSCFVIAGVAVALHPFVPRQVFAWALVVLLAVMTTLPGWVAFGPGERHCTSLASLPVAEYGCRIAFGVSAFIMAGMTVIAVVLARKGKNAA